MRKLGDLAHVQRKKAMLLLGFGAVVAILSAG